jgi:hypothetical protein
VDDQEIAGQSAGFLGAAFDPLITGDPSLPDYRLPGLSPRRELPDRRLRRRGGRTPKLGQVSSNAGAAADGRDHWPYCYTALFAGAGVPAGTVIGASDKQGAYPKGEAYGPEDLAATIYARMGVPAETEIRDPLGQPHALVLGKPIRGLVGR